MDKVTIYFCKITDTEIDRSVVRFLPPNRQDRITNSMRKSSAVQLYISSMLCDFVLRKHGLSLSKVKHNSDGKPYVDAELHFNISHSGDYVVLALSDREIGIDIQKNVPISERAAKFFLNAEEIAFVKEHPEISLAHLWCKKEAFLKCLGCGWNNKEAHKCPTLSDKIVFRSDEYFLTDCDVVENYFLVVCEKNLPHREFVTQEVSKCELERFFREHYGNDPRK